MTARVAAVWRHPIKSCGRERVGSVTLVAGESMPFDRRWAVLHDAAPAVPDGWAPCPNFQRGARTPALAAIWAELDEAEGRLRLTHADRPPIEVRPDDPADAARFLDWLRPLCPPEGTQPRALVARPGRGMTDADFPCVSLATLASHAAVENAHGAALEPERWRANLWIEGPTAWEEASWPGHRLRVGEAELEAVEEIGRCLHTAASPRTGRRDVDSLGALDRARGRRDFGVYARVARGGRVAEGDPVEVLA